MKIVIGIIVVFFMPIVLCANEQTINLLVRTKSTLKIKRYCVELATLPNGRQVNVTHFDWHTPYLSSKTVNACNISSLVQTLPSSFAEKTILLVFEHECKITEHAWNVEQTFGQNISLMIITKRTNTHYELTYNVTAMPVSIPVLVLEEGNFNKMNEKSNNLIEYELSIAYSRDTPRKFRPAIILMFLLVLIVLLCGNLWAGDEFKRKINDLHMNENKQQQNSTKVASNEENTSLKIITKQNIVKPNKNSANQDEPAVIPVTYCIIGVIICFAVAWLLLLFFFPKVMIYILQVMFCIGAFSSVTSCLNRLSYFVSILRRFSIPSYTIRRPCAAKLGPLNYFSLFSLAISLTMVIIWYVYRHSDWSWILQDILGAAICMRIVSLYRLSNMRVITIILIAFFLYDIFFVFITPYIPIFQQSKTPDYSNMTTVSPPTNVSVTTTKPPRNPSVMEQVALGIGTNGEVVPLLFALPMFIPESEINPCAENRLSMLGFGDVILPGILLTFCKIFDIASANRFPIYHIQSVISYFVGLTITHIALYFMDTAQPALLYLVPCLLLSTIVTGLIRRELKELFNGKRIEALLKEPIQNTRSLTENGFDNPLAPQIHDE